MKLFYLIISIALVFAISTGNVHSQTCKTIDSSQLIPAEPDENDAITLELAGTWCVSVADVASQWDVAKKTITVDVTVTSGFLQILSSWNTTVPLGTLRHGMYTLEVRLHDASTGQLVDQKSLTVRVRKKNK